MQFKTELQMKNENFLTITYWHILLGKKDPEELVRSAIEVG